MARGVDQVQNLLILNVMVVSDVVLRRDGAHYIVEDGERSVIRLVVGDYQEDSLACMQVGRVVRIFSPHYRICPDGTHCIFVMLAQLLARFGPRATICWLVVPAAQAAAPVRALPSRRLLLVQLSARGVAEARPQNAVRLVQHQEVERMIK